MTNSNLHITLRSVTPEEMQELAREHDIPLETCEGQARMLTPAELAAISKSQTPIDETRPTYVNYAGPRIRSFGDVQTDEIKTAGHEWHVANGANNQPYATFQDRVQPWMMECFGAAISADRIERNHRFFEESTELVQANGMTRSEAHQLVDYTFDRPVGELTQEVGGVQVTLAALCLASGADMHAAGEIELARINQPEIITKIRAKQAAKPKHSPLPEMPK